MQLITLATNISVVAAQPAKTPNPYKPEYKNSFFEVVGTLTGCTATLQTLAPDAATWLDVPGTPVTVAPAAIECTLPPGPCRLNLVGGTCSGVSAWVLAP